MMRSFQEIIIGIVAGIIISILLVYMYIRTGGKLKLEPKQLDQIKTDLRKKPLGDVIADINSWLS